jgi:hypothetical protein
MQRSKIKVGEAYAVVASQARRRPGTPVKGTVLALDGKYMARKGQGGSYWAREREFTDGIVVKFDEPMVRQYDSFEPLAKALVRLNEYAGREARENAVTEAVLQAAQMVTEPWAAYAERRAHFDAAEERWAKEADAKGEAVEPRYEAVIEKLESLGIAYRAKRDTRKGTNGLRTLGASFTLGLDEIEQLIGA